MNSASVIASGGRGGGGLQFVSLTRINVNATSVVSVNGRGGTGPSIGTGNQTAGGGGGGGTLMIEAPAVNVSTGAIIVANGGGGAGGGWYTIGGTPTIFRHYDGQPGQLSAARAAGGDCPTVGDGGFEANGATSPSANGSVSDSMATTAGGGGGGGSSGFIYLRGRAAGNVTMAGGSVVSPTPSVGAVGAN